MGQPVVRWQIISANPESTVAFYRELFGGKDKRDNALGYREVNTGSNGINGGVWPGPPDVQPFVQLFVEVPDVDKHIERATKRGAQVLVPASALPDGDTMAVLRDPAGLPFAIVKSAGG